MNHFLNNFNIRAYPSFFHPVLSCIVNDQVTEFIQVHEQYTGDMKAGKACLNDLVILCASKNIIVYLLNEKKWGFEAFLLKNRKNNLIDIVNNRYCFEEEFVSHVLTHVIEHKLLTPARNKKIAYGLVKTARINSLKLLLDKTRFQADYYMFKNLLFCIKNINSNRFMQQLDCLQLLCETISKRAKCIEYFLRQINKNSHYVDTYFYEHCAWKEQILQDCLGKRLLKHIHYKEHAYGFIYDEQHLNMDFISFVIKYVFVHYDHRIHQGDANIVQELLNIVSVCGDILPEAKMFVQSHLNALKLSMQA